MLFYMLGVSFIILIVSSLFLKDTYIILMSIVSTLLIIMVIWSTNSMLDDKVRSGEKISIYLKQDYTTENKEISYFIMEETISNKLISKKITLKSGLLLKTSLNDIENNKEVYTHFDEFINFEIDSDSSSYKYVQFDEYPNKIFPITELYKTKKDGIYEVMNEENYITKEYELVKVNNEN